MFQFTEANPSDAASPQWLISGFKFMNSWWCRWWYISLYSWNTFNSKYNIRLIKLLNKTCQTEIHVDLLAHYENMPIQIYWKFNHPKNENFQIKNSNIFLVSAQNIDCGYSLEPPRRGGSNEYPQSMFWAEIWKIMYTPVNPSFTI